ncbi:MAG: hypothetical protein PHC39_11015 [Proteiniphilum sp.]|nr:hypothetical protein [Proteiniphilum sp.]
MDGDISEMAAAMGKKGGKATLEKHSLEHFKEMGRKSGEARRKKAEKKKRESQKK